MNFSLGDFVVALGLAFAVEGLIFMAAPDHARRILASAAGSPPQQLRIAGLISAVVGIVVVWLVRG